MKPALIILYALFAVQSLIITVAFKFGFDTIKAAFRYSADSIIQICDQRYVQK